MRRTHITSGKLCSSHIRYLVLALLFIAGEPLLQPYDAAAQTSYPGNGTEASSQIVIGFVGGFVHKDDIRHSEVQLGDRLKSDYGKGVHVEILENRQIAKAQKEVLQWLDENRDGDLSRREKQSARIILFGHSWGAAAAVSLAHELGRDGIPVLLTVQVDTVSKSEEDNSLIPENVSEAANFYQTGGILHGSQIRAADLSRTRILGNFRFHYQKEPPECRSYPWYDRVFFKGHTAIECDPQVWSQVESLIRARLSPTLARSQPQLGKEQGN
jgi:hypothetical protein